MTMIGETLGVIVVVVSTALVARFIAVRAARERVPRTCGSCRYYDTGACRRYPPARVYGGDKPGELDVTVWPVVRLEQDWCGEYMRYSSQPWGGSGKP